MKGWVESQDTYKVLDVPQNVTIYDATEHKACNKAFRRIYDLDKYIDTKCGKIMCMQCDKVCSNETVIEKHYKGVS